MRRRTTHFGQLLFLLRIQVSKRHYILKPEKKITIDSTLWVLQGKKSENIKKEHE